MKSILIELQCPHCGSKKHVKSESFINPMFEPELKQAILEDTFFVHKCHVCHQLIHYQHPLLYHDNKNHYILYLMEENQEINLQYEKQIIKRVIRTVNELKEKIKIFDDHLDDRIIELLKVKLLRQYKKNNQMISSLQYHDYDHSSSTIWFTKVRQEAELIAVDKGYYDEMKRYLNQGNTFEVNISWAIEMLEIY